MLNKILKTKKIILFDGSCALCNKFIVFVAKNDTKDCFRFMSLQDKRTPSIINLNTTHSQHFNSIVLIDKNNIKSKSNAILSILIMMPFPYNLSIIIYIIPKIIRDAVYRTIAKNRYKTFGKTDYCSIINHKKNSKYIRGKMI